MERRRIVWCAALLGGLLACGSETPQSPSGAPMGAAPDQAEAAWSESEVDSPPAIADLRLEPAQPHPGETVSVHVDAEDPDDDLVRFSYEWRVDGERTGETGDSFRIPSDAKNALIEVIVIARNDGGQSQPERATARIGNLPPQLLGVLIEPLQEVTADHDILASPQATDPDGDEVEFRFTWRVNGHVVGDDTPVLESRHYRRGDRISLRVTASDGEDESDPLTSDEIVVMNAAPRITSVPDQSFDEHGVFRYAISAEDPDGDRVFRYELRDGPAGMKLDAVGGTVEWAPGETQAGVHPVEVEVSDRKGGAAVQSFDVTVAFETLPESPAAPAP